MNFKQFLEEQKENHAVLAFGRMNPPTTGHEVLVNKVKSVAAEVGGSHHVVLSHSQDAAKNPLSAEQKVKHAKRFFPDTNISTSDKEHPTFLQHAAKLHKQGVTHLHMVAGSDRVAEYKQKLAQYNGTHKGALYNFKKITVHSAGERDPDAEGTSGMSASKMRGHAAAGKFNEFRKGIPAHVKDSHAKELYNDVRKNMGVKEDVNDEFEELLTEGVHDKGIFKAMFLAGGPGSGKDFVLDNTLAGHGLTEINSDKALEYLMDKENLDKRMPDNEEKQRDVIRSKAKGMTELRQKLALNGRNGLIINGTGDDYEKIKRIKEKLELLGYETSMITVNTRDDVSALRNIQRGQQGGRTVPEKIRKQKWDAVQQARPKLAELFKGNYIEFDNSEDLRNAHPDIIDAKKQEMDDIFKQVQKFVNKPPKSEQSQQWVGNELAKKDTLPVPKSNRESSHRDIGSKAAQEAKQLGLSYFGFGRWGKNGKVTHHEVHGKLVVVEKQESKPESSMKTDSKVTSGVKLNPAMKDKLNKAKQNSPIKKLSSAEKKVKGMNEEFEDFLNEAVTVTITGDTPEEVSKTLRLLKSDDVEDVKEEDEIQHTSFSNGDALTLLTLGKGLIRETTDVKFKNTSMTPGQIAKKHAAPLSQIKKQLEMGRKIEHEHTKNDEVAYDIAKNHVSEKPNYYTKLNKVVESEQKDDLHPSKLMQNSRGEVRTFNLRRAAAAEAHTRNGVVYKLGNHYVVKIKENEDVEQNHVMVQEANRTENRRITTRSTNGNGISESSRAGVSSTSTKKITLEEIRLRQKEKLNEIDAGIEPGLSMASSGENFSRGIDRSMSTSGVKFSRDPKKKTIKELTGDETTMSIGDQKELELKRKGIDLASFKAKKFVG